MPEACQDFAELRTRRPRPPNPVPLQSGFILPLPSWEQALFQDPSCELSSGIKSLHALFIKWGSNSRENLLGLSWPTHPPQSACLHQPASTWRDKKNTRLSSPPHLLVVSSLLKEGPGLIDWTSKGPEKAVEGTRPRMLWFAWERPILSSESSASSQRESLEPGGMRGKEGGCDWNSPGGWGRGERGALTPTASLQTTEPQASRFNYLVALTQQTSVFSPQSSTGLCFEAVSGILSSQNVCRRMGNQE